MRRGAGPKTAGSGRDSHALAAVGGGGKPRGEAPPLIRVTDGALAGVWGTNRAAGGGGTGSVGHGHPRRHAVTQGGPGRAGLERGGGGDLTQVAETDGLDAPAQLLPRAA